MSRLLLLPVLFPLLLVLCISHLSFLDAAIPQFTCPIIGSAPVQIRAPVSTLSRTVYLVKSAKDTLCTLTRVTPVKANASLADLSSWDMIPVARSYLQQDWESTAGMYAARQVVKSCKSNNSTRCVVVLPSLPSATALTSLFLLTSYAYSMDVPSQVARFLEQTTFGPTLQGIKNFIDSGATTGKDLQTQMALWVKNQMNPNFTPPTYHREYFRKRVGGAMTDGR